MSSSVNLIELSCAINHDTVCMAVRLAFARIFSFASQISECISISVIEETMLAECIREKETDLV